MAFPYQMTISKRIQSPVNENVLSFTMQSQNPLKSIQTRFKTQVFDWIVTSKSLFSSAKNPEFVKLFSLANLDLQNPSHTTIQRRIIVRCNSRKNIVLVVINDRKGRVSLSSDAWPSRIYSGYMVVT